jgi:hypothetical protein
MNSMKRNSEKNGYTEGIASVYPVDELLLFHRPKHDAGDEVALQEGIDHQLLNVGLKWVVAFIGSEYQALKELVPVIHTSEEGYVGNNGDGTRHYNHEQNLPRSRAQHPLNYYQNFWISYLFVFIIQGYLCKKL